MTGRTDQIWQGVILACVIGHILFTVLVAAWG